MLQLEVSWLLSAQSLNPCFSGSWVLRSRLKKQTKQLLSCLNPCFSGSWVLRFKADFIEAIEELGLNPCFSGSWVLRVIEVKAEETDDEVLILVLVEVGF